MNYIQRLTLKEAADEDQPRKKLIRKGRQSLSDAELIAILLGTGTTKLTAVELAQGLLNAVNHNLNELGKLNTGDLCKFHGIGEAKAVSIIASLELGRRRKDSAPVKKPRIISSKDAYQQFAPLLTDLQQEEFWVLLLNRANRLEEAVQISRGGLTATVVDSKLVFKAAIDRLATGIILGHNHPSGELHPSDADIELTRKINLAGKTLDIQILDHIIVAGNSYYSFSDNGKM